MEKFDIVILGAGPIGLFAARELHEEYTICIIEKNTNFYDNGNRVINKEAFRKLKLREEDTIQKIERIDFYSPNLTVVETGKKGKIRGYSVNKATIQKSIHDNLNNEVNFKFEEFIDFDYMKKIIKTNYSEISYDFFLSADGAFSKVRNKICSEKPINIYCHCEIFKGHKDRTTTILSNEFAHGFYGWIMPLGENYEIGVGSYSNPKQNFKKMINEYQLFKDFKENPIGRSGGVIPLSHIGGKQINNFVIMGDATGGESMMGSSIHKGIDEARIACDLIRNENSLEEYEIKWNEKFSANFKEQMAVRKNLDSLKPEEINEKFSRYKNIDGEGMITGLFKEIIR